MPPGHRSRDSAHRSGASGLRSLDPGLRGGEWLGLAALLGLAAGLRAFAWSRTAVLFNDGPVFLAMAEAIASGRWDEVLAHPYHPLYPAAVAGLSGLLGLSDPADHELAAVAVSIAGGTLAVGAVFALVRRLFDPGLAWLAAWTVTLHPWAVDFSSDVMSDGLYAGLYLSGLAALAASLDRPSVWTGAACGAVSALAYLTRPEGVGLVIVALPLLLARGLGSPGLRRRVVVAGASLVLAVGIGMAPLLVPLTLERGAPTLTRKKAIGALVAGAEPGAGAQSALEARTSAALERIPLPRSAQRLGGEGARRPPRSLLGVVEALDRALRTSLAALRYEIGLFAAVGLWLVATGGADRRETMPVSGSMSQRDSSPWREALRLREATLLLPAALYTGVLVLLVWGAGYVARRHALAALLPLVGYAAMGWRALHAVVVDRVLGRNAEARARAKAPRMVALGLAIVLALVWGARDARVRRADRFALREAAEWLAPRAEGGAVAAQKLRVAYYARSPFVPLPSGADGRLEAHLRGEGARWVVIDAARLADHRGLAAGIGEWLERVHVVERAGQTAWVLALRPPAS